MSSGIGGQFDGVACASATLCLGVGYGDVSNSGVAVPLDPASGGVVSGQSFEAISGTGELKAVACASRDSVPGRRSEPCGGGRGGAA